MGQVSSTSQSQFPKAYELVATLSDGGVLLKHTLTNNECLFKTIIFMSVEETNDHFKILSRRKSILNPHLLEAYEINTIHQTQACSQHYRIELLIEYPFKSLAQDIFYRRNHNFKYFEEEELWSIMYSCCSALKQIYGKDMIHQSLSTREIFITNAGFIKIGDPILTRTEKNYLRLMKSNNTEHRYISPQLVALVRENNFYHYNKLSSDVYILGLILLEASTLQQIASFKGKQGQFDFKEVENRLTEVKNKYSLGFSAFLECMLEVDPKCREDFNKIVNRIEEQANIIDSCDQSELEQSRNVINSLLSQKKTCQQQLSNKNTSQGIKTYTCNPRNEYPTFQVLPKTPAILNLEQHQSKTVWVKKPVLSIDIPPTKKVSFLKINESSSQIANQSANQSTNQNVHQSTNQNVHQSTNQIRRQQPVSGTKEQFKPVSSICTPVHLYSSYTPYEKLLGLSYNQKSSEKTLIDELQYRPENTYEVNDFDLPQSARSRPINQQANFANIRFWETQAGYLPPQHPIYSYDIPEIDSILRESRRNSPFRKNHDTTYHHHQDSQYISNIPSVYAPSLSKYASHPTESVYTPNTEANLSEPIYVIEGGEMSNHYEGYKLRGLRQGTGRLYFVDGGYYEGQWSQDQMNGYGKLYYPNKKLAYEGYWRNDQFWGLGKLHNNSPQPTAQYFNYLDFTTISGKWLSYEGEFQADKKQGKGLLLLANGESFEGRFENNAVEGEGVFKKRNGQTVKGHWKHNILMSEHA